MNVKYYANDMKEAMIKIKKELGPEAKIISSKLVHSKKGLFGMFSPKVYEVIVDYDLSIKRSFGKSKDILVDTVDAGKSQTKSSKNSKKTKSIKENKHTNKSKNNSGATFDLESNIVPEDTKPKALRDTKFEVVDIVKEQSIRKAVESIDRAQKIQQESRKATEQKEQVVDESIKKLDNKISDLSNIITDFSTKFNHLKKDMSYDYSPAVETKLIKLTENDVEEEIAHEICQKLMDISNKENVDINKALEYFIDDILGKVKTIEANQYEQTVVLMIGPTGVGKTTTLVKIASDFVVNKKLKVGVINSDVYRVGAKEQLKTYCEILNIPMVTIYKPEELKDALEKLSDVDIVFIDTAGKVSYDKQHKDDIETMMDLGVIDYTYLVLCGSSSLKILKATVDNYTFLKNHSLIVTKIDEGVKSGTLLNIKKYSDRPLSYVTVGQTVPDDIKIITKDVFKDIMR